MDHSKDSLTPAQQREARRKLRRRLGGDTPEEQAKHLLAQVFAKASKRRTPEGRANAVVGVLSDFLRAVLARGRE